MTDFSYADLEGSFYNATRQQHAQLAKAITDWRILNLRQIPWQPSIETEPNHFTMGYPLYPEEIWRIYEALTEFMPLLGANVLTEGAPADITAAPLGYVLKALLVTYRVERFADGTIAAAVEQGVLEQALDRVVAALREGNGSVTTG